MYDNGKHITKQYYTIGEVAQLFSVSTSLLRYWEKEFKQLKPQKSKQGIRKYTQADIAQFRVIYHLIKEQGYTIRGARAYLKSKGYKLKDSVELIHALKDLRAFLVALRSKSLPT
ncbi:MAG: MerR family transcriptional regulator [Bacteroidota bacterium]